jgi:hypothetical protein
MSLPRIEALVQLAQPFIQPLDHWIQEPGLDPALFTRTVAQDPPETLSVSHSSLEVLPDLPDQASKFSIPGDPVAETLSEMERRALRLFNQGDGLTAVCSGTDVRRLAAMSAKFPSPCSPSWFQVIPKPVETPLRPEYSLP